jgi:heterodisulfide reductase subunit A2
MIKKKTIVTIGGGLAGIEASSLLAEMGYEVLLIEKSQEIGGKILKWDHLFPSFTSAQELCDNIVLKCKTPNLKILTKTELVNIKKSRNDFFIQTNHNLSFKADAIVIATGFDLFDASRKEEYGYHIYDNVITSADLEKKLKSKGKITIANGTTPKNIAFVHCVGSRDEKVGNHYCSKVCCVTAVKQAIELNKKMPDTMCYCFYMDLRMFGRGYEELYRSAQEQHNIQFIRGRVSEVSEKSDGSLIVKAEDTLAGRPLRMNVDMLVLMSGMEPGKGTLDTGKLLELEHGKDGFINTADSFAGRNLTKIPGVFVAGTCSGPMTVSETIENARSSALQVQNYFKNSKNERLRIFRNK